MENTEYICRFTDYLRAKHERQVKYLPDKWIINDKIFGEFKNFILRWHLEDINWTLEQQCLKADNVEIFVKSNKVTVKYSFWWKSFLWAEDNIPVLKITANSGPINIQTEIKLRK